MRKYIFYNLNFVDPSFIKVYRIFRNAYFTFVICISHLCWPCAKQFCKVVDVRRSIVEIQKPVRRISIRINSSCTGVQGKTASRYIKRTVCSNISNERPVGSARCYRTGKYRKPNSRDSTEISGLWDYR